LDSDADEDFFVWEGLSLRGRIWRVECRGCPALLNIVDELVFAANIEIRVLLPGERASGKSSLVAEDLTATVTFLSPVFSHSSR